MPRAVHIFAPSRLHFGLLSFSTQERQYGGVGVMIDRPGVRVAFANDDELRACGPLAERALCFAERWGEAHAQRPNGAITIEQAPPEHVGLGVGTQLGLTIAAGLNALHGLPAASAIELAASVGRGERSAIGAHGFVHGGLLVERGKRSGELLSPLDCRIDMPETWRFLLVRPSGVSGLSGEDESRAFPPASRALDDMTAALTAEINQRLVPAAATADFPAFADSLYRYGRQAGLCFAHCQGGAYNGPVLTKLVETLRRIGAQGVGQSSWGPTIYAVAPDQSRAEELQRDLAATWTGAELHFAIAKPWNQPADIQVTDS